MADVGGGMAQTKKRKWGVCAAKANVFVGKSEKSIKNFFHEKIQKINFFRTQIKLSIFLPRRLE